MKRQITKQEQAYINDLLRKRKEKELDKMIGGVFTTKYQDRARMVQYDYDNTVEYKNRLGGMTNLEIEQFNNTYNNFK